MQGSHHTAIFPSLPMILRHIRTALFFMSPLLPSLASANFSIETDFPGGNALVEKIEGNVVHIAPDNRDSRLPWFYWYFAIKGAGGQTVTFVLNPMHIGARGPGISTDGGATWSWLGAESAKDGTFSHTFPAAANDVRFSSGMPYVKSNFDKFLAAHKDNPFLHVETLAKTGKGRSAPLLLLTDSQRKAPYVVALTARMHCCEMMGSYVLEGIIEGVLANDEYGQWLRKNVDFFIMPFSDFDGVEDGDQGKNRTPHDHNRDFGDGSIYPEVIALKERLPAWSNGRPLVFFDIHNPALKGDVHEVIQFLAGESPEQADSLAKFAALLERNQQGELLFRQNMIMKFGTGYNKWSETPPPISSGWARTLPNCILSATLELPYANASAMTVNADSARSFGRDIAWALKSFLQENPAARRQ